MGIPIISTIVDGVGKLVGLVDDLHTSDEERLNAKAALLTVQATLISQALTMQQELTAAQRDIIVAETKADSWLTRSWRPIVMLTLTALAVYGYVSGGALPAELWTVIKIGLGGYIAGRSAEKIVPGVVNALKQEEKT